MSTGEANEMNEHPSAPSEETGEFRRGNDSLSASDGSHSAEVMVDERKEFRIVINEFKDIFGENRGLLSGNGSNSGQGRGIRRREKSGAIADSKDVIVESVLDHKELVDPDTAVANTKAAAIFDEVNSANAGSPDNGSSGDFDAALQLQNVAVIADNLSIEQNFNALRFILFRR